MKFVVTALLPAVALLFGASMLPAASYADSASLTSNIVQKDAVDGVENPEHSKDAVDGVEDDGPNHP